MARMILDEGPKITPEAQFYWNEFLELDSERPPSMGGLPRIPMTAILTWAEYLDLDLRQTDDFVRIIRTLDVRKCALVSEKTSEKRKAQTK